MMRSLSTAIVLALVTATGAARADEIAFRGDIQQLTRRNTDFRHVLFTGRNIQIVAMSLAPGEDIGEEVHKVDQCFFLVEGSAQAMIQGKAADVDPNGTLCVPAGTRHNVRNTGRQALKLYTIYAPPQHPPRTVHRTKADAQRAGD